MEILTSVVRTAITIVIFSGWRPARALIAAYAFGGLTSLSFTLQLLGVKVPSDILALIPFLFFMALWIGGNDYLNVAFSGTTATMTSAAPPSSATCSR